MENDNRNSRIKEMNDVIYKLYSEGTSKEYDLEDDDSLFRSASAERASASEKSINVPRSERVAEGMRSRSSSRVTSVDMSSIDDAPVRRRPQQPGSSSRPATRTSNATRTSGSSRNASSVRSSGMQRSSVSSRTGTSRTQTATRLQTAERTSGTRTATSGRTSSSRPSSVRSEGSQGNTYAPELPDISATGSLSYSDMLQEKERQRRQNTSSTRRTASGSSKGNSSRSSSKKNSGTGSKKSSSRKKGMSGFGKFLIIYSAVLLVAIIVTCIILNSFLKNYEKNQPSNVAAQVVSQFDTSDKLRKFLDDNESITNKSTAILNYEDAFISAVEGKKVSYVEDPGKTTSEVTCYKITADNIPVADITLTKGEKGAFGLASWVLSAIDTSNAFSDVKTYSILVPEGSSVIVNGTTLSESMISGTGIPEVLETSKDFIASPPTYTTYNVKVVGDSIDVAGTDSTGANLVFSQTENSYVAGGQASADFIESVSERVEDGLREYALYFIYNAFNLEDYIVDGCEMHANIFGGTFNGETFDRIDPWLYYYEVIDHFEFSTFDVKNYVKYSDDCFTVDVSYKLDMYFTDPSYSDDNQKLDATWVWVKQGDQWYLSSSKTY